MPSTYDHRRKRQAGVGTFTEADIERLRKDVLQLAKNVDRVKDYHDADALKRATITWRKHFETELQNIRDELTLSVRVYLTGGTNYLPAFADEEKKWWEYWDKKLRDGTWDLIISLSAPVESAEYAAKKWDRPHDQGPQISYVQWERDKKAWAEKLKRVARKAWKTLTELLEWFSAKRVPLRRKMHERQKQEIHGFRVILDGFEEGDQDALVRCTLGLQLYRRRAGQVAPFLLRLQLPLVFEFQYGSYGGRYENDHILVNTHDVDGPNRFVHVVAHEMGHHIYRTYLSQSDKAFWREILAGDFGDLDLRDVLNEWKPNESMIDLEERLLKQDPVFYLRVTSVLRGKHRQISDVNSREELSKYLAEGGEPVLRVSKTPITAYASTNDEEAFCETLGLLVAYGPRTLDEKVIFWLRTILPSEVRVASRGVSPRHVRAARRSPWARPIH